MLGVGNQCILHVICFFQCITYRIQTSVTICLGSDHTAFKGRCNLCGDVSVLLEMYFLNIQRFLDIFESFFEQFKNFIRMKFFMSMI